MIFATRFNSFTQELCINDAVKVGYRQYKHHAERLTDTVFYLQGSNTTASATTITPNTPQEVNWTAKFVDRVSEVTDGLNVSGKISSLGLRAIACEANTNVQLARIRLSSDQV